MRNPKLGKNNYILIDVCYNVKLKYYYNMNATSVLNKIVTLLAKQEVKMTYAKLEDGTIVESPTFDVGEPVEVVTEEGKTPAPDGEHNLFLRDEEGNEVHIRVITKDGVIVERENVEEMEEEIKEEEDVKMSEETVEVEPLPGEPGYEEMKVQMADYGKKMEEMAYRIEEMEKAIAEMKKIDMEDMEEDEEEEVSPLNGAPVEMSKQTLNLGKPSKNDKIGSAQASFLSKLYK
jgi:hypothetical protein